jgi:hypothetical protein
MSPLAYFGLSISNASNSLPRIWNGTTSDEEYHLLASGFNLVTKHMQTATLMLRLLSAVMKCGFVALDGSISDLEEGRKT